MFIVSMARSGSTLLRYVLDSHPDVVSPPELNLSALLQHVVEVWSRANDARGRSRAPVEPIPAEVRRRARRTVDDIMAAFAADSGASVFCDKSLTTVDHLSVVSQCYPDASYVFLYRYPLDFIASGIEACQWGYNGYGFGPYVAGSVDNFVAGLGNYWIDRVTKMVEFERSCEVAHARIYYELLCDDDIGTVADLLQFLELEADDRLVTQAFDIDHGRGSGDYKIDFTRSISADSIGRGRTIPQLLHPAQVAPINELLSHLDYPSLESAWRGDLRSLLGLKSAKASAGESRRVADKVAGTLSARQHRHLAEAYRSVFPVEVVVQAAADEDAVLLISEDGSVASAPVTWAPDQTSRPRLRCSGDVLLRVLAGEVTFGQAVHDGRVRVEQVPGQSPAADRPRQVLTAVAALLAAEP